ncbi:hypothetical protein DRQ36_10155 [bacterium]|nr:MAG: hypothetical protein DRQ36_10155 [bacterium]
MSGKKRIWPVIKTILAASVLVWWGIMVVMLYYRNKAPEIVDIPDFNIIDAGVLLSENYYSVTFRGEKIGYSSVIKRQLQNGFLYQESSFYRLPVGGVTHEITAQGLLTVDDSLRTKIITFLFSGDEYETTVNASVRGSTLVATIESQAGITQKSYQLTGPIYSSTVIPELLAKNTFNPAHIEIPTFDPLTFTERKYSIVVRGRDKIKRFGSREVMVVGIGFGGVYGTMFIDTAGVLLMEKTPEGFMSVREKKEVAFDIDMKTGGTKDLLDEFAIPLGLSTIERPREAIFLRLEIENLSEGVFELNDFNQSWDPKKKLLTIDIRGIPRDSLLPAITHSDTSATFDIQCRDRRIFSTAEKITGYSRGNLERLKAINEYLYENIDKGYTASIPSAIDVLGQMRGDCNEHTILFVALARALGIPARMNIGLLYIDGYFYYHAWPQAYADGAWHSFDPTLGQYPADATHIKLTSGSLESALALMRIGDATLKLDSLAYPDE